MPYARFQKLDEDRRYAIMEASAQVFAEHGYHGASINQILQNANLSKGVAYYYFEDKADLFATTVEFYLQEIDTNIRDRINELTADNFWEMVLTLYSEPFILSLDAPYRFQVLKVATQIPADDPLIKRITPLIEMAFGWTIELVTKGREYGLVREDLPDEMLYGFMSAIDTVADNYILERVDTLTADEIVEIQAKVVDAIRRLLSP